MADYAAKPTKAKEDVHIIDQRKRMLAVFLNRCRRMKEVVEDGVWWRFLDPNSSWVSKTPQSQFSALTSCAERSTTCAPSLVRTEEQPESTSSGSREPYTRSQLVTYTFVLCEAKVWWLFFSKWNSDFSSRTDLPFSCSAYDTWPANLRPLSS